MIRIHLNQDGFYFLSAFISNNGRFYTNYTILNGKVGSYGEGFIHHGTSTR